MRQDSVQFIQAVVGDHELALARGGMLQLDRRAELVGEVILEPLDVRVLRTLAGFGALAIAGMESIDRAAMSASKEGA